MEYIKILNDKGNKALNVLNSKYISLRATGSHPDLLQNIMVEYYGEMTPLSQTSNIKSPDAMQLIVMPFEPTKEFNKEVTAAILASDLGLSVVDEGNQLRIPVPPINEEKRKIYVKEASIHAEQTKVAIRNIRQDILKKIKSDDSLSDDMKKTLEKQVQIEVDSLNKKVEEIRNLKEQELLTI
jgi:ribosome recycling factor